MMTWTRRKKNNVLMYRLVNFYSFISCTIIASRRYLCRHCHHRCRCHWYRVSHFHQTLAIPLIRIMAATISWKLTTAIPNHQKTWKVCMPVPLSTIPVLNFITRPHYENMMLGYCQLVSLNKRFSLFPLCHPRVALRIRIILLPFSTSSNVVWTLFCRRMAML